MSAMILSQATETAHSLLRSCDKDVLDDDTKVSIEGALSKLSSRQRYIALTRAFEFAIDPSINGGNSFVFSVKHMLRAAEEASKTCAERDLFIAVAAQMDFDVDKELTIEFCEKTMEEMTYAERKRMLDKEIQRSMTEFGTCRKSSKKRRVQVGTELFETMKKNAELWSNCEIVRAMCTRTKSENDGLIERAEKALCHQFERPLNYEEMDPTFVAHRLETAWKTVIEKMPAKQLSNAFSCGQFSYSPEKGLPDAPAAYFVDPADDEEADDADAPHHKIILLGFYGHTVVEVKIDLTKKKLRDFLDELVDYIKGSWLCEYDE